MIKKLLRDDVYVEIVDAPESDIIKKPDWNSSFNTDPDTPVRGRVLKTGKGKTVKSGRFLSPSVKAGDLIHFYFGAVELYYPDRKHAVINHDLIQAVLEP